MKKGKNLSVVVDYLSKEEKKKHKVSIINDDTEKEIDFEFHPRAFWRKPITYKKACNFIKQHKDIDEISWKLELEKSWNKVKEEAQKKKDETKIIYSPTTYPAVLEVNKKWLYIEEEADLEIILACALDRKIIGEPIWLFIVAPPGNTKTELVRSFLDGNMFYQLSTLTTNSLISGYIKPDGEKVEDLAVQLEGKVLVIKDFTSILSMNKEKRDEIIGQLRESYDGYINKKLGNLDKKLSYKVSFGLIAGVTPIIDKYYSVMAQLGERFLKLRLNYDDVKLLEKTEDNEGKEKEMRDEISKVIMGFLTNVEIKELNFTEESIVKIKSLARWVAKMRTPIMSSYVNDELVMDIKPQSEKPGRLYKQFKKLARALATIRQEDEFNNTIYSRLRRVGRDSTPPDRLMVWDYLTKEIDWVEEQTIIDGLRIPRTSLRRLLYALYRLELVDLSRERIEKEDEKPYYINSWRISDDGKKLNEGIGSAYSSGQTKNPDQRNTHPLSPNTLKKQLGETYG